MMQPDKNTMEQLKIEYQTIEIPDKLKTIVCDTMEDALRKKHRRRRVRTYIKPMAAAAVIVILGAAAVYGRMPSSINELEIDTAYVNILPLEKQSKGFKQFTQSVKIEEIEDHIAKIIEVYEQDLIDWGVASEDDICSSYEILVNTDQWLAMAIITESGSLDQTLKHKIYYLNKTEGLLFDTAALFERDCHYESEILDYLLMNTDAEITAFEDEVQLYINDDNQLVAVFAQHAGEEIVLSEYEIPLEITKSLLVENWIERMYGD